LDGYNDKEKRLIFNAIKNLKNNKVYKRDLGIIKEILDNIDLPLPVKPVKEDYAIAPNIFEDSHDSLECQNI